MHYVNNATRIRRELMTRIARLFFKDRLEDIDRIPLTMFPKGTSSVRCCLHKDRAVLKYRLMALLGHRAEEETDELTTLKQYMQQALDRKSPGSPILTVIDEACSACVRANYFVTNACQGCVARPCMMNCPKDAIEMKNGQAEIDPDKCVNCGLCMKNCPYHAIIFMPVPCEEACPVGAISKDPQGKEQIDYNKCTFCGKCMRECPFGAIMERSQMVDVLCALQSEQKTTAMIAPAIVGQFSADMGSMVTAIRKLGFDHVVEVAWGADETARHESAELLERLGAGADFMTTSCCPTYVETVRKHLPEMEGYISETPSPMHYTAMAAKKKWPEARTVFIGPCVAKRHEGILDYCVDYVLSIEELGTLFVAADIDVQKCGISEADLSGGKQGRGFPASEGVTNAVKSMLGPGESVTTAIVNGLDRKSIRLLRCMPGKPAAQFLEVMACEGGCIAGPDVISNPGMACRHLNKLLADSDENPEQTD